jgi:hypothetical protein
MLRFELRFELRFKCALRSAAQRGVAQIVSTLTISSLRTVVKIA